MGRLKRPFNLSLLKTIERIPKYEEYNSAELGED
jgi:hypothetical protein